MEEKNYIDELAELVRKRWEGKLEDEEAMYMKLAAFAADRQDICGREETRDPDKRKIERAAFSVLRMAITERSTAVNMRREPGDYVDPAGHYPDKATVLQASD